MHSSCPEMTLTVLRADRLHHPHPSDASPNPKSLPRPSPPPFQLPAPSLAVLGHTRWPTCLHSRHAKARMAWCTAWPRPPPQCPHNEVQSLVWCRAAHQIPSSCHSSFTWASPGALHVPGFTHGLLRAPTGPRVCMCGSLGPKWMSFPLYLQSTWLCPRSL